MAPAMISGRGADTQFQLDLYIVGAFSSTRVSRCAAEETEILGANLLRDRHDYVRDAPLRGEILRASTGSAAVRCCCSF